SRRRAAKRPLCRSRGQVHRCLANQAGAGAIAGGTRHFAAAGADRHSGHDRRAGGCASAILRGSAVGALVQVRVRPLGQTGLTVSALGLGTVKFGRNTGVKYPRSFELPDRSAAANLLSLARDLGINLLDTAPAYGESEERLGELLQGQRQDWLICTKAG